MSTDNDKPIDIDDKMAILLFRRTPNIDNLLHDSPNPTKDLFLQHIFCHLKIIMSNQEFESKIYLTSSLESYMFYSTVKDAEYLICHLITKNGKTIERNLKIQKAFLKSIFQNLDTLATNLYIYCVAQQIT